MGKIEQDCLRKKTTVKKAETEIEVHDDKLGTNPNPLGVMHNDWALFKSQMKKGDELWEFSSPPQGFWESKGLCIVRNGEIIDCIVTDNIENYGPENGVFVCSGIKKALRKYHRYHRQNLLRRREMKDNELFDRKAYQLAKDYLPAQCIEGVTPEVIEKYLNPLTLYPKPASKEGIYQRILESAQNANMKARVIGGAIDGVEKLAIVLENFNPRGVIDKYADDWEAILNEIVETLEPRGKIRRTSRAIWPHYCRTILSAANFVEQFSSASDFFDWVDFFNRDDRARASLPMLLSQEIEGLGFALSCDFLKEMGYVNFPKPDVHLRHIFTALNLCRDKADDYQLFKAVIRVAAHAGVSAYNADKVFWLIGSGNFYNDQHIGNKGRIGSRKAEFIEYAKPLLDHDRTMNTKQHDFDSFWRSLEAILTAVPSSDTVFNQYRDRNDQVDVLDAAAIRTENLRRYMANAIETASILVVGEAAGPWGCRFSGVPFTSEKQLIDPCILPFPLRGKRSSRAILTCHTKVSPPFTSRSAEIFWSVMKPYHSRFLVWDAFPFHPHEPHDFLTVRNPTQKEIKQFGEALLLIIKYMNPTHIVAVGKKAEEVLKTLKEKRRITTHNKPEYVRHPSRGGEGKFKEKMESLFNKWETKG
jgi:hypothetical protein